MNTTHQIPLGNISRHKAEAINHAFRMAGFRTWVGKAERWAEKLRDPAYADYVSQIQFAFLIQRPPAP